MATSSVIDFDFDAAIAEKNKFARRPVEPRPESSVDLATAKALSEAEAEPSPQNVRLLIAVENTDYRAYLSSLATMPTVPERSAQPLSHADAQILNAASAWTQHLQAVAIFSCYSKTGYSEVCSLGIRLIGSGLESEDSFSGQSTFKAKATEKAMLRLAADFCPTHIIMNTPNQRLLSWANRHHISSIVLIDDWQAAPLGRQQRRQHRRLIELLNRPSVKWIGSRGLSACQSMANSGVAAGKLIPWEWPKLRAFNQYPPKALDLQSDCIQLLYSGALDSPSRVGDLLRALSQLKQKEHPAELQIVVDEATPKAALESLALHSQQLDVTEAITLVFTRSVEQLIAQVRAADVVVIPGCVPGADADDEPPLLIQAARAACTPIVACDRANLKAHLTHGINAMIFPEGNEKSMVHRIERLIGQPQLYEQLSEAGILTQHPMDAPAPWKDLTEQWISDRPANKEWLKSYAFLSGRYQLEPFVA